MHKEHTWGPTQVLMVGRRERVQEGQTLIAICCGYWPTVADRQEQSSCFTDGVQFHRIRRGQKTRRIQCEMLRSWTIVHSHSWETQLL